LTDLPYIPPVEIFRIKDATFEKRSVDGKKKVKSFARLAGKPFAIRGNSYRNRTNHQSPASTMKTLLTACLCSLALVLTSLAQSPAPPETAPPGVSPVASPAAPTDLAAPAQLPTTASPPAGAAAPPEATITATLSPAPAAESPAPAVETAPTGSGASNFLIDNFKRGGPVMWPILIISIIGLTVVIERIFWWTGRWFRRDPKRIEKVFTAIENNDLAEASRLSRGSRDPVLRMMWNGLNHQHASLQGALQVAAGIEIKRAGRFLVVMDTLVTLAPLLGLLGTVTGLIRAFGALGNEELAIVAVTGGIAEALIATACGLGIAIFALVPFNFFNSRVSNLEFELQTAATNLEVMLGAQTAAREMEIAGTAPPTGKGSSI
jgi:biopolymer transport protein ExbB